MEKEHDSGEGNYILRLKLNASPILLFGILVGLKLSVVLSPERFYKVITCFYSRRFTLVWGQRGPGPSSHGPGYHRAC